MRKIFSLIIFGISFGLVEASVVYYIQHLIGLSFQHLPNLNYSVALDLKAIAFIVPHEPILKTTEITSVEMFREFATIVMLASLAIAVGNTVKQRIGAFLLTFAIWDIFYYVFLIFFTGWPNSLFSIDVYFLLPVPWVGPVITPVLLSSITAIFGARLYLSYGKKASTN